MAFLSYLCFGMLSAAAVGAVQQLAVLLFRTVVPSGDHTVTGLAADCTDYQLSSK